MCRPYCFTPDFHGLPEVPGMPGRRHVHGIPMTEEEYRIIGWHSRGTYPTDRGTTEHQWIAPLSGHMAWAQKTYRDREQRIAEAQNRRQADDEYSAAVAADIERGGHR